MHNTYKLTLKKKSSFFILLLSISAFFAPYNTVFSNTTDFSKKNINYSQSQECIAGITITRRSTAELYINDDISPEKKGQYALYEVKNTGVTTIDAYVKIDNFAGDIRLGDSADKLYHIGQLAPDETDHAYLYLVTDLTISGQNGSESGTNTHDVNVYNGDPDNSGVLLHSETFGINVIEDVIKASANKVMGVSVNGTPAVGGTFSITVNGETGTIGAAKVVNFSAATNINWPANAIKLTHTIVDFTKVGNGKNDNDGLSFENELNFEVLDTKNTAYEITYTFFVLSANSTVSGYEPTAYISSGTQFKHSVLNSGVSVPDIPASGSTLSGFVWSDDDFDGIKQSGESKMNGVKVRLLDASGVELMSTSSSGATGDFEFTGVSTGTYQIRFDRNDRFVASKQNKTPVDSLNSDMNRATRLVYLNVTAGTDIKHITAGFTPDFDRDLIPDVVENAGSTSYDAVDPAGYFYDETTGESISGGWVVVSGPGSINIVDSGFDTGYYSWLIDGTPGVYTMTVIPPGGYEISNTRAALSTLDPTGLPDPYSVGAGDLDDNGFIDDHSFSANPYYLTFELASGDPFVINNNIPLTATALPVEISRFTATEKDCSVAINWTTESEENFNHFQLEHSEDGKYFKAIKTQTGNSTYENQQMDYSYIDKSPSAVNYYRLKMVDLDRSFKYSEVIVVNTSCNNLDQIVKVFPNPISSDQHELSISVDYEVSKNVTLSIINAQGLKVKEQNVFFESGINEVNWDISDLPGGAYFLILDKNNGINNVKQFIKSYD